MQRKKRDRVEHAYNQGFRAGIRGHYMEICKVWESQARGAWLQGWREGRDYFLNNDKFERSIFHGRLKAS